MGPTRLKFDELDMDIQNAIGRLYVTIFLKHPEWSGAQITIEDPRKETPPTVDVRYLEKPTDFVPRTLVDRGY